MARGTISYGRKANRVAAVTSAVVVAFAAVFIGVVLLLDAIAPSNEPDDIVIESSRAAAKVTDPFYVLLIGSDTRKGTALYTGKATDHAQVDQHSDVMTLVRVDPKKYKISLLTIPRDTVISGETNKINDALLDNDPTQVVDAVQRLTGLRADYYMMTTFSTFEALVNSIDGIDVDVPLDIEVGDPATGGTVKVKAGKNQHLDGSKTLAFARARHEYVEDQDYYRQRNVRAIERAIIEKVLTYPDAVNVEHMLASVETDVKTDVDLAQLGGVILDFIQHADKVTFIQGTGPYGGGPRESDGQWVVDEDVKTWKKVMKAFKKGKEYSEIVSKAEAKKRAEKERAAKRASKSSSSSSAKSSSGSSAK